MAQMHGYELALWLMGVVMPLIVAVRIWQAGLLSEYRDLVRYNLVCAASLPVLAVTLQYYPPPKAGFCVYCLVWWSVVIATDACALAVLLSIFREIFKPYDALKQLGNVMFRWTLGVLVAVALVSAVSAGAPRYIDTVNHTLLMFDRGLQILQCGVVLFLLLSSQFLGISFRHRVFGISVGFGLYASVDLLAVSVSTWAPQSVISIVGAVANAAAMVGYGVWLVYFYVPQPERRLSEAQPESRRWEYALASIQTPAPEGMFLTSIDRTVERLLTKNNVATTQKPKEDKHWFGD